MPLPQQVEAALWGIGLGGGLILIVYLIVSNAWFRSATGDRIPETDTRPTPIGMVDEYPEGLAEAHGRPTLFFKGLAVVYTIWMVGYVTYWLIARWP